MARTTMLMARVPQATLTLRVISILFIECAVGPRIGVAA
jgi:hypothetical protein